MHILYLCTVIASLSKEICEPKALGAEVETMNYIL